MKKIFAFLLAVIFIFSLCLSFSSCKREGVGNKTYSVEKYRTTMQFYDDFKILQLTDLHFGIETDIALQLDIVKNAIEEANPDLIILTGDNFMYSTKGIVKTLFSFLNDECKALTEKRGRLTKFTVTFGNHDNQGDYSRYFINEVVSSYATTDGDEIKDSKYAAFIDFEDDDIFGLTNFYIDLVDRQGDTLDVKYRIHIIDSNSYHFVGPDYDYDVIHTSQLKHAKNIYANTTKDDTYIGLAFFHIPLYEYQEAWKNYESSNSNGQGEFREDALYAYENNGAYKALHDANIIGFFCGHDHINYGDFIYKNEAIFSYGVKTTNQLYHDTDMIGYKTITLKDLSKEEFLSYENIKENFENVTGEYENYEKD